MLQKYLFVIKFTFCGKTLCVAVRGAAQELCSEAKNIVLRTNKNAFGTVFARSGLWHFFYGLHHCIYHIRKLNLVFVKFYFSRVSCFFHECYIVFRSSSSVYTVYRYKNFPCVEYDQSEYMHLIR